MQLSKGDFERILKRYLSGEATPEEVLFVERYYQAFELEASYTDSLGEIEKVSLEKRIKQGVDHNIGGLQRSLSPKKSVLRRYLAVVSFLLLLFGYYTYETWYPNLFTNTESANIIIDPNKTEAGSEPMLKLANGTLVKLDSLGEASKLLQDAGNRVRRSDANELVYQEETNGTEKTTYNELMVPRGKQFKIILPDGTKVWLNAASTLRYPTSFNGADRIVLLSGEAYFEVAADKNRPFSVQSKTSEIKVTGTSFNVSAYADETAVKTTLITGGVDIYDDGERLQLQPGEQSTSGGKGVLSKKKVDVAEVMAWRQGFLEFNQSFGEVIRMISRWYGVEIQMDSTIDQSRIAGRFSNKRDIEEVLSFLKELKGFKYTVEGKKIKLTNLKE